MPFAMAMGVWRFAAPAVWLCGDLLDSNGLREAVCLALSTSPGFTGRRTHLLCQRLRQRAIISPPARFQLLTTVR